MQPAKKPSLQEINRRRQQDAFIGREEQISLFRENLALSLDNDQRRYIFAISGQGGVGKTTLLRRLRRIAEENNAICAFTDDSETDVPGVMAKMAAQLRAQGYACDAFEKRYQSYLQLIQKLEADPDAPEGFPCWRGRHWRGAGSNWRARSPASTWRFL